MTSRRYAAVIAATLTAVIASACMGHAMKQQSSAGSATASSASCALVASIPYWDQPNAVRALRANSDAIDYISLFWYHLTPNGRVKRYKQARTRRSLVDLAHERGIKVLALVANLPDDEREEGDELTWDAERAGKVLRPASARRAHVEELLALVDSMGFDGVHIDYESLPPSDRADFTRFIAELGEALHAEDKLLAVAVHHQISNDPRNPGAAAQNLRALAAHADQLHVMAYNQHTAGTGPGPVASRSWFESILRHAVDDLDLPPARLFIGLPLYAEEWRATGKGKFVGVDVDLTHADVHRRIDAHGGQEMWSSQHQSPHAVYEDSSGDERVLWFENARSTARKLEVLDELGLCNLALWRVGEEDRDVWPVLRDWLGRADRLERR